MNPLVASAITIFALYVVCVIVYFVATNSEHVKTRVRLSAQKWNTMMREDEDEAPDWADEIKWRESIR